MRIGHATDPGKLRDLNEDNFYINEKLGLFIVADGMGGHNAGEVASALAVTFAGALIEEGLATAKDAAELVRDAVLMTNAVILQKSLNKPAWSEMGTTLVMALFTRDNIIIAHVGDSRAYAVSNGEIRQLTQDHTFVAEWLKQGIISKEEARHHQQRHGLTEALGVTDDVEVDVEVLPRSGKECLLLCTDGLTDMVEDEEILAIAKRSANPDEVCNSLVAAANREGGQDNITAVFICDSN